MAELSERDSEIGDRIGWSHVADTVVQWNDLPGFESVDVEDPTITATPMLGANARAITMILHQNYDGPSGSTHSSHISISASSIYPSRPLVEAVPNDGDGSWSMDQLAVRLGIDTKSLETAVEQVHPRMVEALTAYEQWSNEGIDPVVDRANERVMRMRREVVRTLADAHEELMDSPARERDLLEERTRRRLHALVSQRQVEGAIQDYEAVSDLSGDEATQKEMLARAAHLRAFTESMRRAVDEHRPWLAAMSVTTAEVVRPETLPELRETEEWGVMQQASLEATVSCMPPAPKNWAAADGEGLRRVEAQDADVAMWIRVDRDHSGDHQVAAGHLLREAVGARLKVSCERTDIDWKTMDDAFSKSYEFETRGLAMESLGVPDGADLEEEEFVVIPDQAPLPSTSDWWALHNGIPAAIDSFPAPNESVQQQADVRMKLSRPVWESTRGSMGPAFEDTVIIGEDDVDITISAQQRVELKERAEEIQWTTVHHSEERIDQLRDQEDYGLNGEEQEVERLINETERVAYEYSVVVGALDTAKSATVRNTAPNDSLQPRPGLKIRMQAEEWSRAMKSIGVEHVPVRLRPGSAGRDLVGEISAEDRDRLLAGVNARIEQVNKQYAYASTYDPFTEERPESDPILDYGPSDARWQQIQPLMSAKGNLENARPEPPREPSAQSGVASSYLQPQPTQSAGMSADLDR